MPVKPEAIDGEKAQEIIFQPNPGPQTDFLAAPEQEVLYGGAAGGGKSYAMIADPLRYANNPVSKMLLVRKSTEELRELKSVSKMLYPKAVPGAKFMERDSTWVFPSGATLWLSYLDRDDDVTRYQGQAFNWIGFDELTQWPTPYAWNYLRSRLRVSKNSNLDLYQRATSNPGGVGHGWVKKMFIDPAPYNTPFDATDIDTGEVLRWSEERGGGALFKRRFIPATLFDNPYLSEDGMYEANLMSLPEHERRRLLEGDWAVAEGAAFSEFNPRIHVVPYFEPPHSWVRFRACDYGYSSATGVLWFAIDPDGRIYVYRELYTSKTTAADLAYEILDMERGDRIRYGVLDSSLWHKRGEVGPSLAEQMIVRGCKWRPSDRSKGSVLAGKNEVHRRLSIDPETNEPTLFIMDNCRNLISQLPALPLDRNNPELVDTNAEDHLYDALRYGLMTRPTSRFMDDDVGFVKSYRPSDPVFGY